MNPRAIEVREVLAQETFPLRLEILRPGRSADSARFPGDTEPTTRHFGAFSSGTIRGVASLYLVQMPERAGVLAYQLRGMAAAARGAGLGRALTLACLHFARNRGAALVWCNARTSAVGFYQKLGFEIVGKEFEIPDVGPHFRMVREFGREEIKAPTELA